MDVKRYKAGTLKGEITTAEIRKLIRAHNKASSIKIPPKSSREDIVGILQKAGYVVNHEKAELRPVSKGKVQKLKVISQQTIAQELPKPKPLTEEQKKQRQQAKQKKAGEKAFLKAVIPKPPSVSKPSKGVKVGKPPPKKSKKDEPKKEEPKKEAPKKEAPKNKKGEPYIITKIKDSNAKLYDYNFTKEKDIVKWFNDWKRDRRTLIRELKEALSKGQVTKEDLKPIEPINIHRTKQYKIREGQIFRAIKEQEK